MTKIDTTTAQADLTEALPKPALSRALARVALDFGLGVALFSVAVGGLSLGHGSAVAGAAGWVTTVMPDQALGFVGSETVIWHPTNRQGALLLLAMTFGAVTALNMSMARHLRTAAIPAQKPLDMQT